MKYAIIIMCLCNTVLQAQKDTLVIGKSYQINFDDATIVIERTNSFVKVVNNSTHDLTYYIMMQDDKRQHQEYGIIGKGSTKECFDTNFVINRQKDISIVQAKKIYGTFEGNPKTQRCFIRIKQKKEILCKCQLLNKKGEKITDKVIRYILKDY